MMNIADLLVKKKEQMGRIIPIDLNSENVVVFDFTLKNKTLMKINVADPELFGNYIQKVLAKNNAKIGIGRYNEDRMIYATDMYGGKTERRTIHLGIDIFMNEGTSIMCPIDGKIHSFQNNSAKGDYGPTIILEHFVDKWNTFYTLYGHLSLDSITNLKEGMQFRKGDLIGKIGHHAINGGWPEHLHFQIIADLEGRRGDFPGVCSNSDREKYVKLCPNPNLILNLKLLAHL